MVIDIYLYYYNIVRNHWILYLILDMVPYYI